MQVVVETAVVKYETKKSTFVAHAAPMKNFNVLYEELKNEHPKAAHIVWAYRYLNEYNQIVENSSDDKEPKGTSGPPILNVMRGLKLVNSAILVVRYFGGIKLGTGGLVRAYGTSAKLALEASRIDKYEIKEDFIFTCNYNLIGKIEHFLTKNSIFLYKREFKDTNVYWKISITENQKIEILHFFEDLIKTGNIKVI